MISDLLRGNWTSVRLRIDAWNVREKLQPTMARISKTLSCSITVQPQTVLMSPLRHERKLASGPVADI